MAKTQLNFCMFSYVVFAAIYQVPGEPSIPTNTETCPNIALRIIQKYLYGNTCNKANSGSSVDENTHPIEEIVNLSLSRTETTNFPVLVGTTDQTEEKNPLIDEYEVSTASFSRSNQITNNTKHHTEEIVNIPLSGTETIKSLDLIGSMQQTKKGNRIRAKHEIRAFPYVQIDNLFMMVINNFGKDNSGHNTQAKVNISIFGQETKHTSDHSKNPSIVKHEVSTAPPSQINAIADNSGHHTEAKVNDSLFRPETTKFRDLISTTDHSKNPSIVEYGVSTAPSSQINEIADSTTDQKEEGIIKLFGTETTLSLDLSGTTDQIEENIPPLQIDQITTTLMGSEITKFPNLISSNGHKEEDSDKTSIHPYFKISAYLKALLNFTQPFGFYNHLPTQLLIDELRDKFWILERRIWITLDSRKLNWTSEETKLLLSLAFYEMMLQIDQMPENPLYGTQQIRKIHAFGSTYVYLYKVQDTYLILRDCLYNYTRDFYDFIKKYEADWREITKTRKEEFQTLSLEEAEGIRELIRVAETKKEVERLEKILKSGNQLSGDSLREVLRSLSQKKEEDAHEEEKNRMSFVRDLRSMMRNSVSKMSPKYCYTSEMVQSTQQAFSNLYTFISFFDLKAYFMEQFYYLVLLGGHEVCFPKNRGPLTKTNIKEALKISSEARNEYVFLVSATQKAIFPYFDKRYQKYWKCNLDQWTLGENFVRFERFLQGYVGHEYKTKTSACSRSCNHWDMREVSNCSEYTTDFCSRREQCLGTLSNCIFSGNSATVCHSPLNSSRRFEWLQFDNYLMGTNNKHECSDPSYKLSKVNKYHLYYVHCDFCICLCEDKSEKAEIYMSLDNVMADSRTNSVVTGIRIHKKDKVIHLQIQEGQMLPYGYVNQSTVRWAPVNGFQSLATLSSAKNTLVLPEHYRGSDRKIITGVTFASSWLTSDKGFIEFLVHFSPFNWNTGVVKHSSGKWTSSSFPPAEENAVSSQLSTSKSPKTVKFTHSDWTKDAAQNTIPFFDAQKVETQPAQPLAGASLALKTAKNMESMITPVVYTYSFLDQP